MNFRRRYLSSLLSAEPLPITEPVLRHPSGARWWRRYLASLCDVPVQSQPSQHAAVQSTSDASAEDLAHNRSRRSPNTLFRIAPAPGSPPAAKTRQAAAPIVKNRQLTGPRIAVSVRSNRPGPLRWALAAALVCALVGVVTLTLSRPSGPNVTQPAPTYPLESPSPSLGDTPLPTQEPSGPASHGGNGAVGGSGRGSGGSSGTTNPPSGSAPGTVTRWSAYFQGYYFGYAKIPILVSWTKVSGATSYDIHYTNDGKGNPSDRTDTVIPVGDVSSHTIDSQYSGDNICIWLRAVNSYGRSVWSQSICAVTPE